MRYGILILSAIWSIGCGLEEADGLEDADGTDGEVLETFDGTADGPARPLGTFRRESTTGGITTLLLKNDATWASLSVVLCAVAPCEPRPAAGTIRFTRRRTHRYLALERDEHAPQRFEYWLDDAGRTLTLRAIGSRERVEFVRDAETPPYCQAASDCGAVQGSVGPRCGGSWGCVADACAFHCGAPR